METPQPQKVKSSTVIDREEKAVIEGSRGQRPYRIDQIYQWLYDNSDSRGIVLYNQREIAVGIDISYQYVCTILSGLVQIGYLKKYGDFFEVVYDPEDLDWPDDVKIKLQEIRKTFEESWHKKRRAK